MRFPIRGCRNSARRLAVSLLALALAVPIAWAAPPEDSPTGAPLRLVPERATPAQPAAAAPDISASIRATPLGPLDQSWAGALPKDEPALPAEMWQGTPRATVRALLPLLGSSESPGIRALARRLLLSGATAPAGDDPADGPSLVLLRAEALARLGAIAGARQVLDAAPEAGRTEAALRLRIELAFAGSDVTDGCERVAAGLADHRNVWWDEANIACQLLAGATDKASLALDLLHDSGAPADPTFDALVAAASGQAAVLPPGAALSPLRATLWAVGKRPLPDAAIARADAATLAAFAGGDGAPVANRLAAAERAAALGAWVPERLAELYGKAGGSDAERAAALANAKAGDTATGRAMLFALAQNGGDAGPRIQALSRFLDAARRHDFYFVAARLAAPLILAIGPGDAAKSAAPQFIRALIAAGRPQDIAPFLPLADAGDIGPLAAIVHLLASGHARQDDRTMGEALAALTLRPSAATPRHIGWFLTLATAFGGPLPAPDLAAQIAPGHAATMPSAALWLDQQQAQAGHRVGETVLTSLVLAVQDGRMTDEPLLLRRAVAGLRAVGLDPEASGLALEAAIAGGL